MLELTIIGNLGRDAEQRSINGRDYITFSVCHSDKYTDKNGTTREQTTWVSCYKTLPSKILPYLRKGTKVYLRGTFTVKHTRTHGNDYVNINCNVSKIQILSSPADTRAEASSIPLPPPPPEPEDFSEPELPY